jgi:hypothetical protein
MELVAKKLITSHDRFNLHKILGVGCLLHFVYRFAFVGEADMNFSGTNATAFCIAWHLTLSCSSLLFKIPQKRVMASGTEGSMIWPEFRFHSIIFASRSLACMILVHVEQRMGIGQFEWINVLIVFATMYMASSASGQAPSGTAQAVGSGTIRDLAAPPGLRFFFSVMQFHATAGCMMGVRRYSTQFIYLWIIQFTAFLMTLRRKNLVPHTPLVVTYAVMLTIGLCISTHDLIIGQCFYATHILANGAALLRMGLGMDKYLVWLIGTVFVVATKFYPTVDLALLYLLSVGGVIAVGVKKLAFSSTYTSPAEKPQKEHSS